MAVSEGQNTPELAGLLAAFNELRRCRQQIAEAASLAVHPAQQHKADHDLQRRGVGFQLADRIHAMHDVIELDGPERQEAQQLAAVDAEARDLLATESPPSITPSSV
jgi:hypothetical protein